MEQAGESYLHAVVCSKTLRINTAEGHLHWEPRSSAQLLRSQFFHDSMVAMLLLLAYRPSVSLIPYFVKRGSGDKLYEGEESGNVRKR